MNTTSVVSNSNPKYFRILLAVCGTALALMLIAMITEGDSRKAGVSPQIILNGEALQYNKGDLLEMEVVQMLPAKTEDNLFGYEVVALRYPGGGVSEIALANKGISLTPGDKVTASWFVATKSGVSTSHHRMMMVHRKIDPIAQK